MFGITPSARLRPSPFFEATLAAGICGDWIRDLRYFWFRESAIVGIPVVVARSGWSKQGGYEIYLRDGTKGTALWNIFREAGAPYDIGPGNPNWCERMESQVGGQMLAGSLCDLPCL